MIAMKSRVCRVDVCECVWFVWRGCGSVCVCVSKCESVDGWFDADAHVYVCVILCVSVMCVCQDSAILVLPVSTEKYTVHSLETSYLNITKYISTQKTLRPTRHKIKTKQNKKKQNKK